MKKIRYCYRFRQFQFMESVKLFPLRRLNEKIIFELSLMTNVIDILSWSKYVLVREMENGNIYNTFLQSGMERKKSIFNIWHKTYDITHCSWTVDPFLIFGTHQLIHLHYDKKNGTSTIQITMTNRTFCRFGVPLIVES